MGVITGVTWDDGCTFCSSNECIENTYDFQGVLKPTGGKDCHIPDPECMKGAQVSETCPLQVYVVWTGTDADGKYLRSAELRFSEFKSYSLTNFASDASEKYKDAKEYSEYVTE